MSHRNWCFTFNNPDWIHYIAFDEMVRTREQIRYLIYQTERGENGTVHIQGYLELTQTMRIPALKTCLGLEQIHLEPRRGTQSQAIEYCRKEDTRVEGGLANQFGIQARQGTRTDLESMRLMIVAGRSELEVAESNFPAWTRAYRAMGLYRSLVARNRVLLDARAGRGRRAPAIEILWGPTGTGKSRRVFERYPSAYWVPRADGVAYFDGVDHDTSVLVFDDFYSWIRYDLLLRICDRYPLQLKVHGGFVQCPDIERVVFTSNRDPRTWYGGWEKMGGWTGGPFARRVLEGGVPIVHMGGENALGFNNADIFG